jgi:hypothetical protein
MMIHVLDLLMQYFYALAETDTRLQSHYPYSVLVGAHYHTTTYGVYRVIVELYIVFGFGTATRRGRGTLSLLALLALLALG